MGKTNVGDVNNMSVQENIHVLEEEILKLSNEKINSSIAEKLNIFYGAKNALENIGVKDLELGKWRFLKENEIQQLLK